MSGCLELSGVLGGIVGACFTGYLCRLHGYYGPMVLVALVEAVAIGVKKAPPMNGSR